MAADPLTLPLPTTTSERLRRVADIIERHPDHWDQGTWVSEHCTPLAAAETARDISTECGTTSCIAGWAVRLATVAEVTHVALNCSAVQGIWTRVGGHLLGLDPELASSLFYGELEDVDVPVLLRRLADLPEGKRTALAAGVELAW